MKLLLHSTRNGFKWLYISFHPNGVVILFLQEWRGHSILYSSRNGVVIPAGMEWIHPIPAGME